MWQVGIWDELLRGRFGIATGFQPGQREIIELLLQGRRVLALQRTGWGKSLCYQFTSTLLPHLTLVFSPLKALMRDQHQRCLSYGISSAIVSSDFSRETNKATLMGASQGAFKVLFLSPERLENGDWLQYLPQLRLSLVVIDEAHCISLWGHDFRPYYRHISSFLALLSPALPVLALTASANRWVEQDILQEIGPQALVVRGSMRCANLSLQIVQTRGDQEKLAYTLSSLQRIPGSGIIYTATRSSAELLAGELAQRDIKAEYYHGGRAEDDRRVIEQRWQDGYYKVLCSTNALGMGIDKRDVRFVVHYHVPGSPIQYYQEIGRAGRDGGFACGILLYDEDDLTLQHSLMQTNRPEGRNYELVHRTLREKPRSFHELRRTTGLAQRVLLKVLLDLEEQGFVRQEPGRPYYMLHERLALADLSNYDLLHRQKARELEDMRRYAGYQGCSMLYLACYLGDLDRQGCGICGNCRLAI